MTSKLWLPKEGMCLRIAVTGDWEVTVNRESIRECVARQRDRYRKAVVWGKTQERVGAAIRRMQRRLPVPLLGLDSDNGSEFINRGQYAYCQDNGITFTRSRPYRKNDSAHVERKNGAVVRRLAGHGRYSAAAAFRRMREVYSLARLQVTSSSLCGG